eukprot:c18756_g4_i3.p1 GENE.c18756_g4_i3~~c18756_g4_i3.p1  ORF type:complete len:741 (+),score=179.95 c18756_g4_i3:196-2418(+)
MFTCDCRFETRSGIKTLNTPEYWHSILSTTPDMVSHWNALITQRGPAATTHALTSLFDLVRAYSLVSITNDDDLRLLSFLTSNSALPRPAELATEFVDFVATLFRFPSNFVVSLPFAPPFVASPVALDFAQRLLKFIGRLAPATHNAVMFTDVEKCTALHPELASCIIAFRQSNGPIGVSPQFVAGAVRKFGMVQSVPNLHEGPWTEIIAHGLVAGVSLRKYFEHICSVGSKGGENGAGVLISEVVAVLVRLTAELGNSDGDAGLMAELRTWPGTSVLGLEDFIELVCTHPSCVFLNRDFAPPWSPSREQESQLRALFRSVGDAVSRSNRPPAFLHPDFCAQIFPPKPPAPLNMAMFCSLARRMQIKCGITDPTSLDFECLLNMGPHTATFYDHFRRGIANAHTVSTRRLLDFFEAQELTHEMELNDGDKALQAALTRSIAERGEERLSLLQFVGLINEFPGNVFLGPSFSATLDNTAPKPVLAITDTETGQWSTPNYETTFDPTQSPTASQLLLFGNLFRVLDDEDQGFLLHTELVRLLAEVADEIGDEEQTEAVLQLIEVLDELENEEVHMSDLTDVLWRSGRDFHFLCEYLTGKDTDPKRSHVVEKSRDSDPELNEDDSSRKARRRSSYGNDSDEDDDPMPPLRRTTLGTNRDSLGHILAANAEHQLMNVFASLAPNTDAISKASLLTELIRVTSKYSDPSSLTSLMRVMTRIEELPGNTVSYDQFAAALGSADLDS